MHVIGACGIVQLIAAIPVFGPCLIFNVNNGCIIFFL